MSKPVKVYLCDLTYDTMILVSDTIPINIGFISILNLEENVSQDYAQDL